MGEPLFEFGKRHTVLLLQSSWIIASDVEPIAATFLRFQSGCDLSDLFVDSQELVE